MSDLYYQDDFVTLYHADSLENQNWKFADVLVTDPPYGIKAEARRGTYRGAGSQVRRASDIEGDESTKSRDIVLSIWGPKPAIVFGSWRSERPEGTKHRLIWHKAGSAPGPTNAAFMSQDEEIYVLGTGFRASSPPLRSVIRTDEGRSNEVARIGHPTPKPLGLMEILLDRCPPGAIADPFAGSGATLVAAKNLGRKVIGVEIEEKYCEIIAKRCSQEVLDFGISA